MMRYVVFLCFVLASGAALGQIEPNTPGGALTVLGANPVAGSPVCIQQSGQMQFEVRASMPQTGYLLAVGQFNPVGFIFTPLANQASNLVLPGAIVVGDGLGSTPGILPPTFFFLNNAAEATWALPVNPNFAGQQFAFQAITFDPTLPGNVNFTAAVDFDIMPTNGFNLLDDINFNGNLDEGWTTYFFQNGPFTFYGQSYDRMSVGTNGWITFNRSDGTGDPANSDDTEIAADFINGGVGLLGGDARPAICPLWEDLTFMRDPCTQQLLLTEQGSVVTVTWENVDYWPAQFIGSVSCTIDFAQNTIMMDYSGYMPGIAPMEGIVGVSDGNYAQLNGFTAGTDLATDLVVGGTNMTVSTGPFGTIYQDFGATEPVDLGGRVLNFVDGSGMGSWMYF